MSKIEINNIEDLENLHPSVRKLFVDTVLNRDFGEELENWIHKLSKLKVFHENTITWNAHRSTSGFHPSSIYSECDYKLYCDYIGAPSNREISTSEQLIFDTGTAIHKQLDYYYYTMAENNKWRYRHDINFQFTDGTINIAGSADGIMHREDNNFIFSILHEYKSINTNSFNNLRDLRYVESNYKRYIYQIQTYMACLNVLFSILVFVSKNDSRLRIYVIPFDKVLWKHICAKLHQIINSKDPIAKTTNTYSCAKFCEYYEFCNPFRNCRISNGNKL